MRTFIFTFICFLIVSIGKAEEARLIRFPHINGKQIVFSYAGDLYTVSDQGGTARKLTSDIGYEMFPRISPDGKYIAFTGQYDGRSNFKRWKSNNPKGVTGKQKERHCYNDRKIKKRIHK